MLYLIGQIILCLLFTFVVGVSVGWLLRGLGTSAQTESIEARWRARLSQLQRAQQVDPGSAEAGDESAALAAARQQIAALQRELQQRDAALEAAQEQRPAATDGDRDLPAGQAGQRARINTGLQRHLAEQKAMAHQLQEQLDRLANEKEMLVQRLRDRETEIGRMGQERQHAINTIASLQKELRGLRGQALRRAEAGEITGSPQVSRPGAAAPAARPARSGHVSGPPVSAGETPAPAAQQQALPISGDTGSASTDYEPDWILSAPDGRKDNLQSIYGIGPKLEMQLNKLGVFHFRQIARFSDKDILWVARHLKSFPGRIVRDQWIQQARTLAQRENG